MPTLFSAHSHFVYHLLPTIFLCTRSLASRRVNATIDLYLRLLLGLVQLVNVGLSKFFESNVFNCFRCGGTALHYLPSSSTSSCARPTRYSGNSTLQYFSYLVLRTMLCPSSAASYKKIIVYKKKKWQSVRYYSRS
jgi:hypothetical protein